MTKRNTLGSLKAMKTIWASFLTFVLFLNGVAQAFADNLSESNQSSSSAIGNSLQTINLVLPKNGGKLERSLSNYTQYGRGYVVQDLTNGVTNEDG